MSNKSKAGMRQFNAVNNSEQFRFLEDKERENIERTSSIRFRRIEVINGKKYRVFS